MSSRFKRRSWGWWLVLLDRRHFKVKLLRFKAGEELSFQYHKHRHELWLFLFGRGIKRVNDSSNAMGAGDFSLVNIFQRHTFMATDTTYVLEVQYGERCVEEDIVRL